MKNASEIAIDSAGRLVIPKAVREAANLRPGLPLRVYAEDGRVMIEPAPRDVRIVRRGRLSVAVPLAAGETLTAAAVQQTLDSLRSERGRRR